jgi:hypothetical protein
MTKKHFETIAKEIRITVDGAESVPELNALQLLAWRLAHQFGKINPRFSRKQFINAIFKG